MQQEAVLITGATQRLGLAMLESLLAQGYAVVTTYRTDKPIIQTLQAKGVTAIQCDLSIATDVEMLCQQVQQNFPVLRAIIHNASDWDSESPHIEPAVLMQKMMQVHVTAPYVINQRLQALLTSKKHSGKTDIIHMTDYVQDKGSKKHIAYAASKAALHNLTLSFAQALAPQVKVNSIAPSLLMFNLGDSDEYKQKALNKSLMQNAPGAQEAVNAMQFLFASDYVTGQTIHLNGGRHLK